MPIPRFHLFEFCDQAWLSGSLRQAYLDCLNFLHGAAKPYSHVPQPYSQWARDAGHPQVLDLASGGGAQISNLIENAQKDAITLPCIILSDLFPSPERWKNLINDYGIKSVGCINEPVSIEHIGHDDIKLLSICTALHHLKPDQVKALFSDVALCRDGLIALEMVQRNWLHVISGLFLVFMCLPAPFFASQFKFSKFLFTTIIPVVPIMASFDGVVSALRCYKPDELIALFPEEEREKFEFKYQEMSYSIFMKSTLFSISRKKPI